MTVHHCIRPTLDDLDPVSRRLLPVLRHFLSNLQGNVPGAWRLGYATALEVWGEPRGLVIAHRAQDFLSAVLSSRPVPFRHADPLCPVARLCLSDDECVLLALLTHMRADEAGPARDMIAALTGGRIEAAVVRTGLDLSAVLDGPHGLARSRARPRLAAVRA